MKQFSIPMALIDYIPVVLFILANGLLIKNFRNKMNKISFYLLVVGTVLVSGAGFLKATYKLLHAMNVGDFMWMSNQFFSINL